MIRRKGLGEFDGQEFDREIIEVSLFTAGILTRQLCAPEPGTFPRGLRGNRTSKIRGSGVAILTRRTAHLPLEGKAKRAVGFVAERKRDGRDRIVRVHEPIACEEHPPPSQVLDD